MNPNNKVNGNEIIFINNYLKCKRAECPNQKTKLAEWTLSVRYPCASSRFRIVAKSMGRLM